MSSFFKRWFFIASVALRCSQKTIMHGASPSGEPQAQPETEPRAAGEPGVTLGSLTERLKKLYELPESKGFNPAGHDGIHAMTGFDISVADELRVAMCEKSLLHRQNKASLNTLLKREDSLYRHFKVALTSRYNLNAAESGLAQKNFRRLQSRAEPISYEEVVELHRLGAEMNETIRRLTGKYYRALTPQEVGQLDFNGVDFVARAQAIKQKYETPKNRRIREAMAKQYYKAALKQGREGDIPAAGSPWHGPHKITCVPAASSGDPALPQRSQGLNSLIMFPEGRTSDGPGIKDVPGVEIPRLPYSAAAAPACHP